MIPQLKKIISKFISTETGSISKKSLIKVGLITSLTSFFLVESAAAGHGSHWALCCPHTYVSYWLPHTNSAPCNAGGTATIIQDAGALHYNNHDHVSGNSDHANGDTYLTATEGTVHCNSLSLNPGQAQIQATHTHDVHNFSGGAGWSGHGSDHVSGCCGHYDHVSYA